MAMKVDPTARQGRGRWGVRDRHGVWSPGLAGDGVEEVWEGGAQPVPPGHMCIVDPAVTGTR